VRFAFRPLKIWDTCYRTSVSPWNRPRCKTDVQSFLGMVNFYRRFIMNCARISRPLTQLTVNTPFTWDDNTQKAFKQLKQALCTAPVLRTFDPQLTIVETTDASGFAIGAVLEQDEDGFRRPVAYFSRTMIHMNKTIALRSKNSSLLSKLSVIGVPAYTARPYSCRQITHRSSISPIKII
jgi:hypothetical protein